MARTYRISLWDTRHESEENALGHTIGREEPFDWLRVPDTYAFTPRHWDNDKDIDVKIRRDDDLAFANEQIRDALADF
jgi:hypothetical protein